MVAQLPEKDELSLTKAQLLARIDVAMGGRVAEEMIFGPDNVTTGASSDFSQATAIAKAMVTQYGMSERVGPIALDPEDISPSMSSIIDEEIRVLLDASHKRAVRVLTEKRKDLEVLAQALIEYETLSREDIQRLLDPRHNHNHPLMYMV